NGSFDSFELSPSPCVPFRSVAKILPLLLRPRIRPFVVIAVDASLDLAVLDLRAPLLGVFVDEGREHLVVEALHPAAADLEVSARDRRHLRSRASRMLRRFGGCFVSRAPSLVFCPGPPTTRAPPPVFTADRITAIAIHIDLP